MSPKQQKPPRILVVDDEPDLQNIISDILSTLQCEVVLASEGLAALQHIKSGSIDVVVSDIHMPALSGMDVLEMVRSYGFNGPYIIVSGYGSKATALDAVRLGAFDFIEKPFEAERIIATVSRALEFAAQTKTAAKPPLINSKKAS